MFQNSRKNKVSHLTFGSHETLEDLDLLPLEQTSHGVYRGSLDVLGLEVPSMELWDEQCGPNDGFGFCGGVNGFIPPKKWKETDDSSSSGVQCEDADPRPHHHLAHAVAPPSLTRVKSVDDSWASQSAPKHRRYRKRTKHGRYATAGDIDFDPTAPIEQTPPAQTTPRGAKGDSAFKRQTATSRSLNHIVRADDYDKGSVTNLFVCGRSHGSDGTSAGSGGGSNLSQHGADDAKRYYMGPKESVFPYGNCIKVRSSSCDELSPRDEPANVRESVRSASQVFYHVEPTPLVGNSNRKGEHGGHKRKSALSATRSWLNKSQEFLTGKGNSQSCESVNAYVPDDPTDLKCLTNVKVIATQNYIAQGAHELSFKKGQKLKLKYPSMDGDHAFGWKRSSRFSAKKYGYFPLSLVKLHVKH